MAGTNARHAASTRKTTCLATTIHQTKPTNTTINRRNKPGLCGSSTPVLPVPLAASAEVGDRHPTTPPSFRGSGGRPKPTTPSHHRGGAGPRPTHRRGGPAPTPQPQATTARARGGPPNPTTQATTARARGPAQPHNPSHHRGGPGGSAPRVKIAGLRRRWAKHTKQQSPRGGGGI